MHPLETYIRELREIRSSGEAVPETSYYGDQPIAPERLDRFVSEEGNITSIRPRSKTLSQKFAFSVPEQSCS